jgi:hypothetical protein
MASVIATQRDGPQADQSGRGAEWPKRGGSDSERRRGWSRCKADETETVFGWEGSEAPDSRERHQGRLSTQSRDQLADEQDQAKKKDQREDGEFGIARRWSGWIPAIEEFDERGEKRGQAEKQNTELEKPPHQLSIARPDVRRSACCPRLSTNLVHDRYNRQST